jgi:shikimate dehydrogenase
VKKSFAVIGNPVEHSLSPLIHRLFAEEFGIRLHYEKILAPRDGFAKAVENFFTQEAACGANVTVPFKEEAFALCQIKSARAMAAQVVNTLTKTEEGLAGDLTDGIGLTRDLEKRFGCHLENQHILILGAGGAAAGIIPALLERNPRLLVVANRTLAKAEKLRERYPQIVVCPLTGPFPDAFDLLINATSAALFQDTPPLLPNIFRKHGVAYDLNYGANAAIFLQRAKKIGAAMAVDGLGMLIEQAAESFFIWHKRMPNTDVVFARLKEQHGHYTRSHS